LSGRGRKTVVEVEKVRGFLVIALAEEVGFADGGFREWNLKSEERLGE